MADAREALQAVKEMDKIVQIGSQRCSAANYIAANKYLNSGKLVIVEMTWNVNQPAGEEDLP